MTQYKYFPPNVTLITSFYVLAEFTTKFKHLLFTQGVCQYPVEKSSESVLTILSSRTYLVPTVEVPAAGLVDQSAGGLSESVAGDAITLSSKLTWDLLPTPVKIEHRLNSIKQEKQKK